MHHWENAHKGHAEHCCCCIPTNIGAHIIGVLVTLNAITCATSFAGAISTGNWGVIGSAGFFFFIIGYVAFRFLKMVMHNDEDTRKHFASAYRCFAHLVTFFLILLFLVMALIGVIAIINGAFGAGAISIGFGLLYAIVGILINVHYLKVVQTYAEHAEEHGHGYEKHH